MWGLMRLSYPVFVLSFYVDKRRQFCKAGERKMVEMGRQPSVSGLQFLDAGSDPSLPSH